METILIDQIGPLPITVNFEGPGDIPVTFHVSGSGWSPNGSEQIGFLVNIDGITRGKAIIFANPSTTHLATVTKAIQINLDPDDGKPTNHTLELVALGNTATDTNDSFSVVMSY